MPYFGVYGFKSTTCWVTPNANSVANYTLQFDDNTYKLVMVPEGQEIPIDESTGSNGGGTGGGGLDYNMLYISVQDMLGAVKQTPVLCVKSATAFTCKVTYVRAGWGWTFFDLGKITHYCAIEDQYVYITLLVYKF